MLHNPRLSSHPTPLISPSAAEERAQSRAGRRVGQQEANRLREAAGALRSRMQRGRAALHTILGLAAAALPVGTPQLEVFRPPQQQQQQATESTSPPTGSGSAATTSRRTGRRHSSSGMTPYDLQQLQRRAGEAEALHAFLWPLLGENSAEAAAWDALHIARDAPTNAAANAPSNGINAVLPGGWSQRGAGYLGGSSGPVRSSHRAVLPPAGQGSNALDSSTSAAAVLVAEAAAFPPSATPLTPATAIPLAAPLPVPAPTGLSGLIQRGPSIKDTPYGQDVLAEPPPPPTRSSPPRFILLAPSSPRVAAGEAAFEVDVDFSPNFVSSSSSSATASASSSASAADAAATAEKAIKAVMGGVTPSSGPVTSGGQVTSGGPVTSGGTIAASPIIGSHGRRGGSARLRSSHSSAPYLIVPSPSPSLNETSAAPAPAPTLANANSKAPAGTATSAPSAQQQRTQHERPNSALVSPYQRPVTVGGGSRHREGPLSSPIRPTATTTSGFRPPSATVRRASLAAGSGAHAAAAAAVQAGGTGGSGTGGGTDSGTSRSSIPPLQKSLPAGYAGNGAGVGVLRHSTSDTAGVPSPFSASAREHTGPSGVGEGTARALLLVRRPSTAGSAPTAGTGGGLGGVLNSSGVPLLNFPLKGTHTPTPSTSTTGAAGGAGAAHDTRDAAAAAATTAFSSTRVKRRARLDTAGRLELRKTVVQLLREQSTHSVDAPPTGMYELG